MSTPALPAPPRRFTTLEAGRAVAACAVVVHHAVLMTAEPRNLGGGVAPVALALSAGVDFFFVLSGFIIAFVHWRDLGRPEAAPGYARARLTRIYPMYWIVLAPVCLIYAATPSFGEARQHVWANVVTSFLLTPTPQQPVLGVAWSLTYEMLFYVLFVGAVLGGRRWLWLGVAWGVAIVAWGVWGGEGFPASFLLNPHNLEFLLGVGCAAWLRSGTVPAPAAWLAAGLVALVALVGWIEPHGLNDPLASATALGLASASAVLGATELERRGRTRAPAWLVALGGASYAVYLIHVVVESAAIRVLLILHLRRADLVVVTLSLLGVASGVVLHVFVERPVMRALRPARAVAAAGA